MRSVRIVGHAEQCGRLGQTTAERGHGTGTLCIIKRMNPDTGAIMAQTANLGNVAGDHGGVAVGVDALYVPVRNPA